MIRRITIFLFFLLLIFNINVFADKPEKIIEVNPENLVETQIEEKIYIQDDGNVFINEDTTELEKSMSNFENLTGIIPFIKTIQTLDGKTINEKADEIYNELFTDENHLLILMAMDEGDIIMMYGDKDSEIVTKEIINGMMISIETDFREFKIADGLNCAIMNGMLLIDNSIREHEDTHVVLEKEEQNHKAFLICIIAGIVVGINSIILIKTFIIDRYKENKKNKEIKKDDDWYFDEEDDIVE